MAKPNRFPGLGALEKKMNMTCVNETIKNCFKNANLPKDYNFTYMKGGNLLQKEDIYIHKYMMTHR